MKRTVIKAVLSFLKQHKRGLLTGVTIVGEVVAIIEAIKQGPEFKRIMDEYEAKKGTEDEMSKGELVKEMAIPALKVAAPAVVSITGAVAGHKIASEAIGSLTSALGVSQAIREEYREATRQIVGDEKAEEIEDKAIQSRIDSDSKTGQINNVIYTGHGMHKFYDAYTGRYFISDANFIESVANNFNNRLKSEMKLSANEFYSDLDLPPVDCGTENGFDIEYGGVGIKITWSNDEGNQPLGIMKFTKAPISMYSGRW